VKLRRQSDQAYADIRLLVASLETEAELRAIGETLRQIRADMATAPPADLLRRVKTSYSDLGKIPDVSDAVKALSGARSVLNDPSPDRQEATVMMDATLAIIGRELAWRSAAKTTLYTELLAFESFARSNLGLREQDRLTPEQVDIITPCLAQHRNLALQF
jgi:hypothetical protein